MSPPLRCSQRSSAVTRPLFILLAGLTFMVYGASETKADGPYGFIGLGSVQLNIYPDGRTSWMVQNPGPIGFGYEGTGHSLSGSSHPWPPTATGGTDVLAVSKDQGETWQTLLQTQPGTGLQVSVIWDAENVGGAPLGLGVVDQSHLAIGPEGDIYESNFGGGDFSVFHSEVGSRWEASELVAPAGNLGDFRAWEVGTPFLTQLHDDLGVLLDAGLTNQGDSDGRAITAALNRQIQGRVIPGLSAPGRRPIAVLVGWLRGGRAGFRFSSHEWMFTQGLGVRLWCAP